MIKTVKCFWQVIQKRSNLLRVSISSLIFSIRTTRQIFSLRVVFSSRCFPWESEGWFPCGFYEWGGVELSGGIRRNMFRHFFSVKMWLKTLLAASLKLLLLLLFFYYYYYYYYYHRYSSDLIFSKRFFRNTRFFLSNRFFKPLCCLTF